MAKRKMKLKDALAADQIKRTKLAHVQKVKAIKEAQQQSHKLKLNRKRNSGHSTSKQSQAISEEGVHEAHPSAPIQTQPLSNISDEGVPSIGCEDSSALVPTDDRPITLPFDQSAPDTDLRNDPGNSSHREKRRRATPSTCMVGPRDQVLLIGEGHLLTATTIDSEEIVLQKYPDAAEFIQTLKKHGVNVLFKLDACNLHKDKRVKNCKFDRVVFNFPHMGSGEADMNRNIKSNQILILKFLRSVNHILRQMSEDDYPLVVDSSDSDSNEVRKAIRPVARQSTVLITLRNCSPYSLWELPKLAKHGPAMAHSILYPTHPALNNPKTPQPTYKVSRSREFCPSHYPGYEHRRTQGFQPGRSTPGSLDVLLPAKLRDQNKTGHVPEESKARTWELELVTPQ
ncbi:uncharacterized protein MELLADRAFT_105880 [Melampsora larici-populina 98AG31]|uniref:25S rRNA (uridine-N(3))-methyltransferase BMT5-like domain-containing protein n=1 Tax=Melampsora larici-populina (strain 98AG31 / pathotype 3-4-7) TaxID=747676 RepID=F4RJM4_MELLP|nr:uncharacterized protein MELLADRAFT_105880 [Melampsora larici-populina 98AG31]EGG07464.1 hypothetical protein MELLADRAFT_105880 [Melampsora larici-populina 98AG31]